MNSNRYTLARCGSQTQAHQHIASYSDFAVAKTRALGLLAAQSATIIGYHLTEVHNAPLHAEFFVVFPDKTHAVYTITETE